MDCSALGEFAANMMDQLAERFADDPNAFVRCFGLLVEIDSPDWPDSEFDTAFSEDRAWVQVGFLNEARIRLEDRMDAARDAEE